MMAKTLVVDEFNIKGFHPSTDQRIDDLTFRTFNRPGKSVEIHTYGPDKNLRSINVFRPGDEVEYSAIWVSSDGYQAGYRSAYIGPIMKITERSVFVQAKCGRVTRLDIKNFAVRNWKGQTLIDFV